MDLLLCAGDAIDHQIEAGTEATIAMLVERRALTIAGNHETWVRADRRRLARLSPPAQEWLLALPDSWRAEIEGVRVAMHPRNARARTWSSLRVAGDGRRSFGSGRAWAAISEDWRRWSTPTEKPAPA